MLNLTQYNFDKNKLLTNESISILEYLNEKICKQLRAHIISLTGSNIHIYSKKCSIQTYIEYKNHITYNTSISIITLNQSRQYHLLMIHPTLINLIIDLLYGGKNQILTPSNIRERTSIDDTIISRCRDMILQQYNDIMFKPIGMQIKLNENIYNIEHLNIEDSTYIIKNEYVLEYEQHKTNFDVIFFYNGIKDILPKIHILDTAIHTTNSKIKDVQLELSIKTNLKHTTLKEILNLRINDFFELTNQSYIETNSDTKIDAIYNHNKHILK